MITGSGRAEASNHQSTKSDRAAQISHKQMHRRC